MNAMKYAKWRKQTHLFRKDDYLCSACGARCPRAFKTCPNCGAIMQKTSYDPRWVDEMEDIHAIFDD